MMRIRIRLITLMRIRIRILFDADPDSYPTFLPDADPDPDPSFRMRIRMSGSTTLILNTLFWQVAKYEATIETYKKRLEEMGDLRGQIKYLEEKNTEYIQKNLDLEDELGNLNKKRPQV